MDGKVALVTGASSGVGQKTAELLARRGARVVLCDLDASGGAVAEGIVTAGGEAVFRTVDVRSLEQLQQAVAVAERSYGRLDTVVANAGTVGGSAVAHRLEDLTDDQWVSIIDVNLVGTMRTFAAAIPALRRAGGGAMSATASIAALTGVAGQAAYSASKGGIVSVVRTLAYELVADGIRVNCVCPGGINTNLLGDTDILPALTAQMEAAATRGDAMSPQELMNRAAQPEEVANVHRFLVSDDASLITGQAVVCDSGSMVANLWMVIDR
ncbi:SDR family oxidoreductase [Acidiferrimicrobium sp. IK]|uniref:SDR family NAD(P)-dependent oxidoreductase n=1 Tax=Acidiferrimicrobium sp. IK TaxID=2871700 RepID=UPI0021CB5E39|nr:SDR family NAD(P)-dependent oxidoreductase [Acidiferrimicrobium sp. IK]MCU4186642.1 SDR family oxidoreductase [Acidiferrimicrobium sp. IK]